MTGYWLRHRALLSIIVSALIAVISVLLFVYPFVSQNAETYNSQSVYKNTDIDFIAPEPSFEQINELSGTNGIEKVFPFFLTKNSVTVGNKSRTTTVLLSDMFQNIDITMYNEKRLIKKSSTEFDNPILVDWKFSKDTSADIGDTVSFSMGGTMAEYKVYAIYETNSVYDGGAIIAQLSSEQKDMIVQNAQNNGYSGMYVKASDYNACQSYFTNVYRPMGRLKGREQFDSDEQYQIHYDAIMSSGYSNEITDFRIRENNLDKSNNSMMILIGTALSAVLIIAFNIIMAKRGSEKGYFTKHCIPKGQNVAPYYTKAFICELICFFVGFAAVMFYKINFSTIFIPKSSLSIEIAFIPIAVLIAEIISFAVNKSMVSKINKAVKEK